MRYPKLHPIRRKRRDTRKFYGLEHTEDVRDGAFYDMLNLSSDSFPLLKTRPERKIWHKYVSGEEQAFPADSAVTAAAEINGRLCWCTRTRLYLNGARVNGINLSDPPSERKIINFGRNVFVVPDGKYVKIDPDDSLSVEHVSFSVTGRMNVAYAFAPDVEQEFSFDEVSDAQPENPADGCRWLDTSQTPLTLRIYDASEQAFTAEYPVYLAVAFSSVGAEAAVGDTVYTKGLGSADRRYVIAYKNTDRLWLEGGYFALTNDRYTMKVEKRMPVLDYAVEHGNRIWGCRYGENENGEFVNEIYASALGDPTSWYKYDGISTDSYCVSLGCSGEFTGAAVLDSDVLFFKENYIIRISGTAPSDYSVRVIPARGIEKNAAKSCVNLNEKIFYKSFTGITVYDGALPYNVSDELGSRRFEDIAAAAFNGKYYVAADIAGEGRYIYVYDTRTGLWHKEDDDLNVRYFVCLGQNLYMICLPENGGNYIIACIDGSFAREAWDLYSDYGSTNVEFGFTSPGAPEWYALSGMMGDRGGTRILRSLVFRIELEKDAVFKAELFCNDSGSPVSLCRFTGAERGAFSVPVNTPRCHTYRLKLSGRGKCTVYSLSEITEELSEVNALGK